MADIDPLDPLELAAEIRRELDALDRVAMSRALRIYGAARARIVAQIEALIDEIIALGIDPAEPFVGNTLSLTTRGELLDQIETILTRAGIQIEPTLIETRRKAIAAAIRFAEQTAIAQGFTLADRIDIARTWTRINEAAVNDLTQRLADGTPLNRWLRRLGPEARIASEQTIERAVVERINVGDLARELVKQTAMNERRALMVARESSFAVHRAAADLTYRSNDHLLRGKMRIERLDEKTCRACLALHGTIYPVDALMPGHPNCRRAEIPVLRIGRGLQAVDKTGEQFVGEMTDRQKHAVLGSRDAVSAWESGEVALGDFVEVGQTEWGPQTRIVGLDKARVNAARRS